MDSEFTFGDMVEFTGGYATLGLEGMTGVVQAHEEVEDEGGIVHVRISIEFIHPVSPEKLRRIPEQ